MQQLVFNYKFNNYSRQISIEFSLSACKWLAHPTEMHRYHHRDMIEWPEYKRSETLMRNERRPEKGFHEFSINFNADHLNATDINSRFDDVHECIHFRSCCLCYVSLADLRKCPCSQTHRWLEEIAHTNSNSRVLFSGVQKWELWVQRRARVKRLIKWDFGFVHY